MTGSHDCTIRVWDLASFSCITTITAHQGETLVHIDIPFSILNTLGPITCLDCNDEMLVTGSSDKYIIYYCVYTSCVTLCIICRYVKAWSCDLYTQLGVMLHHHPVTALIVSKCYYCLYDDPYLLCTFTLSRLSTFCVLVLLVKEPLHFGI